MLPDRPYGFLVMLSSISTPMVCKDLSPSSRLNQLLEGGNQQTRLSNTRSPGNEYFPHPDSREMGWKKRLLKVKSAQWQQKVRTNLALKLGERGGASSIGGASPFYISTL